MVALPGAEIVLALDRGLIDAAEFNNASSAIGRSGSPTSPRPACSRASISRWSSSRSCSTRKVRGPFTQDLKNIIRYAVQASSADMSWKAIARYSQDHLEMQEKQGVKFYRTPEEILKAQLEAWDKVMAAKSAENPSSPRSSTPRRSGRNGWWAGTRT